MTSLFIKTRLLHGAVGRPLQPLAGPLGRFLRVLERHHFPFLQPSSHHLVLVVTLAHLDFANGELLSDLDVDGGLTVPCKARPYRDQQRSLILLDNHFGRGAHARSQTWIEIRKRRPRGKGLLRRAAVPAVAGKHERRDRADPIQLGGELSIGDRVHAHTHALPSFSFPRSTSSSLIST